MPNDMSKEQAAAQRNHADQIKAERAVMRVLGVSRSQAREAINGFQNSSIQQANNRVAPLAAPVSRPEEVYETRPGSSLPLQPFKQAGTADVSGGKGGSDEKVGGFIIVRVDPDDGIARAYEECSLSVELGPEVVI